MSRNVLHFWGGSCSSSPPPAQQRSESLRNKNEIVYRRNGDVISKKGLCFDELLTELSALNNADNVGAAVDAVELIFLGQRLKEQQCEALASRISGGIFLKKVSFDCKYKFDLDTRIFKATSDVDALIGDAGLMAVLDSIIQNQNARIESLILKNCNIGYVGVEALELALRRLQFRQLKELNMKMNPSIGSNIAKLAQQFQYDTLPCLTELNLSDCNLNILGGVVMSRVFAGMTSLQVLNLAHCKIELASLAGFPGKSDGLGCFSALKELNLAGNCLAHSDVDATYTGSSKSWFFDDLARLTSLEILNLANCRLRCDGITMLSKQSLCALSNLTQLDVSVNGLVSLSDDEEGKLDECFSELANGIRHLKKLRKIGFNQGGFSKNVARQLCRAIASLPLPMYDYCNTNRNTVAIEGPIAIDIHYCKPEMPIADLKSLNLPRLMWWDDGDSIKWRYHYSTLQKSQKPQSMRGSQLMKVVEAMRGIDYAAYVHHHSVMAQAHDEVAQSIKNVGGGGAELQLHDEHARFHRQKTEESSLLAADVEAELDIYEEMQQLMIGDVHWPLHCGIQEYFHDEVIEHEVIGRGANGVVKKATILRNLSVLSSFCIKTLPYPREIEVAKRTELHNEIRLMAQFFRQGHSFELKNGKVSLRQGDWFESEGKFQYTAEFLNNFYCCREVDRSKMRDPREWLLDLNGNGICGPFAGPQCSDCIDFQARYNPDSFKDLGYKNLMPIHGVMFKPDPDMVCSLENSSTSGQTFSLIMEYLKYGSLMQRLDAGLAKSKLASPQFRCSRKDWSHSSSMFVGVNDWELKVHLALGIARGICAMHREGVWHRDLKSSNVLIKEYNPVEDVLAVAAARRRGVYPYDVLHSEDSSAPISLPAATPKTPHSAITDICTNLQISDFSRDHAGSLWIVYCNAVFRTLKGVHLDSNSNHVAAACVYLADQSNKAGVCPRCSIETIATVIGCDASHLSRICSKLGPLLSAEYSKMIIAPDTLEFPIFYACVCDFGLSLPSNMPNETKTDGAKGSLSYMAPEIFMKLKPMTPAATSAKSLGSKPHTRNTPTLQTDQESEQRDKYRRRDIWSFGCVLYELATHRRPWYHVLEPTTPSAQESHNELPEIPAHPLQFCQALWNNLGKFHGGTDETGHELKFPHDSWIQNIPGCLLTSIRRCTQKNPLDRPQDIQEIIDELETFKCGEIEAIGSKRPHE